VFNRKHHLVVLENEWVPVSPKKEEPTSTTVATKVAETRVEAEAVNQVFPSAMVTEVGDVCM
jgi:hypothetical protein